MTSNCNCVGTYVDSDNDSVCDGKDVCPNGNDLLDEDGDGIPNYCDCNPSMTGFSGNQLKHTGMGTSSITINLSENDKNPAFTISNIGAKTSGSPSQRFIDKVTVQYLDGNGILNVHGTYLGNVTNMVNIVIEGVVKTVTVLLEDGYDGNYGGNLYIDFSPIAYCKGCSDADGDGYCNDEDQCPDFNNALIGTPCNDFNDCTINDAWSCGFCEGIFADQDGDWICDAADNCASTYNPDQLDADADGEGDACDISYCNNPVSIDFPANPLTHTGSGASQTTIDFPSGIANIGFTVSGLSSYNIGGNNKKHIEQVTVKYINGTGTEIVHGIYSANLFSEVEISIPSILKSLIVELADGDGTPSNMEMSVNLGTVSACAVGAMPMEDAAASSNAAFHDFTMHPNPAKDHVMLDLGMVQPTADITLTNMQGIKIGWTSIENQRNVPLNFRDMQIGGQFVFVTVQVPGNLPITKRLMLMNR